MVIGEIEMPDSEYYRKHKERSDTYMKEWRKAHSMYMKEYSKKYHREHKDEDRAYRKRKDVQARHRESSLRWYYRHPEYSKGYVQRLRGKHPEKFREYQRRWLQNHPEAKERYRRYNTEYYKKHKGDHAEYMREWKKNRGKSRNRLYNSRNRHLRRGIATNTILNIPFKGSELHHLGSGRAAYIPAALHRSVKHSLVRGYNMDEINKLAYEWLGGVSK